jgi:glycerol uptake facilitator-like aquaporin
MEELFAALIGAIIGSVVTVWLTNRYTRQEQRRQNKLQLTLSSLQSRHRAPFWARFLTRPVITTSCAISPELW